MISLLQPPIYYPPYFQNLSDEYKSSMKVLVWKEKIPIHLSNLDANRNPQELGDNSTKVISASGAQSNIACTNFSVVPRSREGSGSHHQILLEDVTEE